MDVPLWALLVTGLAGPIIGAGLTVLGTLLGNRHNAKEAERARRFQLHASAAGWRREQLYALYQEVISYADALYDRLHRDPVTASEAYYSDESQYRILHTRLMLHAPKEAADAFKNYCLYYAQSLTGRPEGQLKVPDDIAAEFARLLSDVHHTIRKHLDSLEQS